MQSFEGIKRDFGYSDDETVKEIGPINLRLEDSEYYDSDERMVNLTKCVSPLGGRNALLSEGQTRHAEFISAGRDGNPGPSFPASQSCEGKKRGQDQCENRLMRLHSLMLTITAHHSCRWIWRLVLPQ